MNSINWKYFMQICFDVDLIKNILSNISIASNSLLLIIVTNLLFFNLDSNIIFPKKFKESKHEFVNNKCAGYKPDNELIDNNSGKQ